MDNHEPKTCLSCGEKLKGRIDKKFCDDYCRNAFNNQLKTSQGRHKLVKTINSTLLKNRKILESFVSEDTAKANREKLLSMGFQFNYITHTYTTRNGKLYSYCYDYGYLPLGNDWYLLVKQKEK